MLASICFHYGQTPTIRINIFTVLHHWGKTLVLRRMLLGGRETPLVDLVQSGHQTIDGCIFFCHFLSKSKSILSVKQQAKMVGKNY